MLEAKLKHLEFIQAIITRMANNSFLIKGWSLTIAAGTCGFALDKTKPLVIAVGVAAAIIFWGLDGYFLHQERLFRDVYNKVAKRSESEIDFSMAPSCSTCTCRYMSATFSPTLIPFHGAIIVACLFLYFTLI
jgi:hypothetical protein